MGILGFAHNYSPVENPIAGPSMGRLREAQQDQLRPPCFGATLIQLTPDTTNTAPAIISKYRQFTRASQHINSYAGDAN